MDSNKEVQYDFCPKCGALARDNVCTSCGFGNTDVATETAIPVNQMQGANVNPYNNQYNSQYSNPYNNVSENPYGEYQNYTSYTNGAIPADVPVKKKNGKVWAIIGVCIGIVVLLVVLLGIAIWQLAAKIDEASSTYGDDLWDDYFEDDYDYDYSYDDYDYYNEDGYDYDKFYEGILEERDNAGQFDAEDDYYYQLSDYIRDDLTYSVSFYQEEYSDGEDVHVYCTYPVLEGDIPNVDYLNEVIYSEYTYFVDYYNENIKTSDTGNEFYALAEGYVTYMDEEVISIVFEEQVEATDYSGVALYCINIDVEKGVIIDNTEIIDADDDFSVDFRIREAAQNQSDVLDYYTDQEITEMLNDSYNLIIFYTPLGLEVGINNDFGWCTATYKDFEDYLKRF